MFFMKEKCTKLKYKYINIQNYINNIIGKKKKEDNLENKEERINNDIKIIKKERNAGIDLLRILGMYAITIHHLLGHGRLINKYRHYPQFRFVNILCFWHISVYCMISGIVGYKGHKYSNLFYLWFSVFFYSVGITYIYKKFKPKINLYQTYEFFIPVISKKYWYFTQYFGMYLFLPIINKGISIVNKKELKIVVLSIILIFIIIKDYFFNNKDPFVFGQGYSVIGMQFFYIIGAYLGKYIIKSNNCKLSNIIYIIIYLSSSYTTYYLNMYNGQYAKTKLISKFKQIFTQRINSFAMISQGISLILLFSQIKYNKYLSKIISFFGPLTFGIYLIHNHRYIIELEFPNIFKKYSTKIPWKTLLNIVLLKGLKIFSVCIIIDYFRFLLFKLLRIRSICIFIEKIINIII